MRWLQKQGSSQVIKIDDVKDLEALYGAPAEASVVKVMDHVTPLYTQWIERSRLCILSTVGPEGTDASPRGDDGPVVRISDPKTLLLPDWRGNNRIDSLRNIVRDDRVSLMFFVLGSNNVVRVNGTAIVTTDDAAIGRFEREGKSPRSIIVVTIREIYSQCARALMRAAAWSGHDHSDGLPTIGELLAEAKEGFDAQSYDTAWAGRAKQTMW